MKNRSIFTAPLAALALLSGASGARAEPVPSGLGAFWSFDGPAVCDPARPDRTVCDALGLHNGALA